MPNTPGLDLTVVLAIVGEQYVALRLRQAEIDQLRQALAEKEAELARLREQQARPEGDESPSGAAPAGPAGSV